MRSFVFALCVYACRGQQHPEGYFDFDSAPHRVPPVVRKPPYVQANVSCSNIDDPPNTVKNLDNLCGDLNRGYIPLNPMKPSGYKGESYPFNLIKTKALEFFAKTLPILKEDRTMPKVAKFSPKTKKKRPSNLFRGRRSAEGHVEMTEDPASRSGRGFCNSSWGVFCKLLKDWSSRDKNNNSNNERVDEPDVNNSNVDGPLTPCPAVVDYVTPVFARNYEGVWRYVVQIPHEGYFTQTVEVNSCVNTRCHYMEGSCLSSPRWVSLLVSELFYPDQTFPLEVPNTLRAPITTHSPPPAAGQSEFPAGYQHRSGVIDNETADYCDGTDELGCYQVRLYYDWFLVPGNCKCWRRDFFNHYRGSGKTPK